METILITGINGYLGSHVAKSLSGNYNIVGLEKSLDDLSRLDGHNFTIFDSQKELSAIFDEYKIDIIIHAATIYRNNPNSSAVDMVETNVILPLKLLEFAENRQCTFINTDTFFNNSYYGYSYLREYTLTKKHILDWAKLLINKGKFINMKIFHMYGPNDSPQKFVNNILSDIKENIPLIKTTPGEQVRDFIYIDDVVNALIFVVKNCSLFDESFIEFEVGTGKGTKLKDFIETGIKIAKSTSRLQLGALPYRKGEIMSAIADTRMLNRYGWSAKFDIERGIEEIFKTI